MKFELLAPLSFGGDFAVTHQNCGATWQLHRCRNSPGRFRYPMTERDTTDFDGEEKRVLRRRPIPQITISGGKKITNRNVVPYSPVLLKLMDSHINVEPFTEGRGVNYIHKYLVKWSERDSCFQRGNTWRSTNCESWWDPWFCLCTVPEHFRSILAPDVIPYALFKPYRFESSDSYARWTECSVFWGSRGRCSH